MVIDTNPTARAAGATVTTGAEAYFAALASLRQGGDAGRLRAAGLLLPVALDAKASTVRQRARAAIKQHFGAVVEDMTPELAAHVAAMLAEREPITPEARPVLQPWQALDMANDNARAAHPGR